MRPLVEKNKTKQKTPIPTETATSTWFGLNNGMITLNAAFSWYDCKAVEPPVNAIPLVPMPILFRPLSTLT